MNIAASNVINSQTQARTDMPPSTGPAPDGDVAGGDPTAVTKGDVQDFGMILSGNIQKGRLEAQQGSTGDGRAIDPATGQPVEPVTADAADATVVADQRPPLDLGAVLDGKVDPSSQGALEPSKASKAADDKKDDPTDAVASDVAAQLALASQWAGLAPAHAATNDPAAGSDRSSGSGDIKATVDDRRAASGRVAATRAAATTAIDLAQVQGVSVPAALNAVASSVDRNARTQATAAVSAIATKPDSLKDAMSESKTVAIDKLFNLAGNASAASPDPASIANSFVSQISAQVSNAQDALGAASATGAAALQETVGTPAWSHELGQAAVRMATNDLQNASLRLNPEHLGPLDVQMRIDNGVAHMQFAALHADTRHALESSRATLDQMFSDQGIKLGDWSVGNSSANGSFARNSGTASSQGDGSRQSANGADSADGDVVTATVTTRPLGLVDTFA